MDDDSSNDVIAMEPTGSHLVEKEAEKPFIQFFKRLIVNNNSQNTVLTNAQLEAILTKEYNFDLSKLHELEVEIYICVLKKYLKDWPKWDEFYVAAKDLTTKGDNEALVPLLEAKYESLKAYIKSNLDIVQPLASEKVKKLKKQAIPTEEPETPNSEEVVLDIQASREQLNKLFYRCPHPGFYNTIFNVGENVAPSLINLNTLSLDAILNWWSIRIQLNLQWVPQTSCMFLKRETAHKIDHLLINQLTERNSSPVVWLDETIKVKDTKKSSLVSVEQILSSLDLLSTKHECAVDGMETVIEFLKKDLLKLPLCVAPAQYKRYMSKHPYVRYLYSDMESAKKSDKVTYDIQLKETVSPLHEFHVGRVDGTLEKTLPAQWLKVECVMCNATFSDANLAVDLKQHFNEYHLVEPDWQCTNCQKSFPMALLAENWWSHECEFAFNKK